MFLLLFLTLYFVFQVCVHVLLTVTIVMNPALGKTVQDIFENIIRYVCHEWRQFMHILFNQRLDKTDCLTVDSSKDKPDV